MIQNLIDTSDLHWIDLQHPTSLEMHEIAKNHELPPETVQDCLDPKHLPKFEALGNTWFLILRTHDQKAHALASSIHELSRKLAIFIIFSGEHHKKIKLITIHRAENLILSGLLKKYNESSKSGLFLLMEILEASFLSFQAPLEQCELKIDQFENKIREKKIHPRDLHQIHEVRRSLSVFKRLFWHHSHVLQQLLTHSNENTRPLARHIKSLKESTEQWMFLADELLEDLTNLLALHVSMASHRTNDIMRTLTICSIFFMPLTFLAGIYGMNFKHMPELQWTYGYPALWSVLLLITVLIAALIRKKGWFN